tara:strand:+ start:3628 stop:3894 length:267 start_codon:yes stop_codon:yes gene_type:complete
MKITKSQLQKIIKEELQTEWNSGEVTDEKFQDVMTQAGYEEIIEIVEDLTQGVVELHLQANSDDYNAMERKLERIMDLLTRGYQNEDY